MPWGKTEKAIEYRKNPLKYRRRNRRWYRRTLVKRQEAKRICLVHYGKRGQHQCCWRGCTVRDLDVLTLDHIKNNGGRDRERWGSGFQFYLRLIRRGFPRGLQTLCMNHQFKKELVRRRKSQ